MKKPLAKPITNSDQKQVATLNRFPARSLRKSLQRVTAFLLSAMLLPLLACGAREPTTAHTQSPAAFKVSEQVPSPRIDSEASSLSPSEPQQPVADQFESHPEVPGKLARIEEHSPEQVAAALTRAEQLFLEGALGGQQTPAELIIHGPEVEVFFSNNYRQYQSIVDTAARLTAFGVVNIRVCEVSLNHYGAPSSTLVPFVGTVAFGPAEEKRLVEEESYVYF